MIFGYLQNLLGLDLHVLVSVSFLILLYRYGV